jgi:hypothetical protein
VYIRAQATDGSTFNAVGLRIGFDPAALTPLTLSPLSSQIGPYMKSSCGSMFHQFRIGAGVDSADCARLGCTSLADSGRVYHLRFRAANTVQLTTLRLLPSTTVVDAGIYVANVTTQDAAIGIGATPVLDAGGPPRASALSLAIGPNPTSGGAVVTFGTALSRDASVTILDLQGRTIRSSTARAGARSLWWDGRDNGGMKVAAGNYLLWVRQGAEQASTRLTVVR